MRKRRRLADKLTISVCAVLVAVSAFFYAPMDVWASSATSYDYDYSELFEADIINPLPYFTRVTSDFSFSSEFLSNIDDDLYYEIDLDYSVSLDFGFHYKFQTSHSFLVNNNNLNSILYLKPDGVTGQYKSWTGNSTFVSKGSDLKEGYKFFWHIMTVEEKRNVNIICDVDYSILSCNILTNDEIESYQNGYNAGYSAGEQAGFGNGYSQGFTDGEASVDTNEIYNQGFNAGKDSVDTQSYYDAGYQAGYQVAYSEGYESGYDEGYQSVMDRIDGWGADTSDYPILVYQKNLSDVSCRMEVVTNMPSVGHGQVNLCNLDININPSHTYKIVFDSVYPSTSVGDMSGSQDEQFNYNIGLFSIPWSSGESFGFVQGSSLSSVFRLEVYDYSAHFYEIGGENDVFQPWDAYRIYNFDSIDVFVYDMGPSGDTQNHIANQTDKLTNGFNDSKGNSVNSDFSAGLNDFETAEDSLFATATTGLKDFTFFDFQSVPAMVTGMSFVGSIMSGWFTQAGGASGVGIVLSILFSIMLVAMVLGLYRWYQSKGGKD